MPLSEFKRLVVKTPPDIHGSLSSPGELNVAQMHLVCLGLSSHRSPENSYFDHLNASFATIASDLPETCRKRSRPHLCG
jgi:hypothetical protein